MTRNLLLLTAMTLAGTLGASADDAVYITPTATNADTLAYNLSVKPVLKHIGNELVVYVNGQEGHHVTIQEGLKMTFGNSILMGDANRDSKVTAADATAVANHFVGKNDDIDKNAADVNYDGKVSVADANNIVNTTK